MATPINNTTQLTSVRVKRDTYRSFKILAIDTNTSLQQLLNQALELFTSDPIFRKKIISKLTEN